MAFERLSAFKDKIVAGAKESANNMWRGTLGGVLDATAGNVYDVLRDAGDVVKHGVGVITQPFARVQHSVQRLFQLRPCKAVTHLAVGVGRAGSNVLEAARSTFNGVVNAGDRVLGGAVRLAGGVLGEDVLSEEYMQKEVPFTMEGVKSGPIVNRTNFFDVAGGNGNGQQEAA